MNQEHINKTEKIYARFNQKENAHSIKHTLHKHEDGALYFSLKHTTYQDVVLSVNDSDYKFVLKSWCFRLTSSDSGACASGRELTERACNPNHLDAYEDHGEWR